METKTRAEKDIELWHNWNNSKSKDDMKVLLNTLKPVIYNETNKWIQSNVSPTFLNVKAHEFAIKGIETFDPNKGIQLNTHITNNLKPLSRLVNTHQNLIRQPEEQIYQYRTLTKQLESEVQNHATDNSWNEKDFSNGVKLSEFKPITEHFYSKASESGGVPVMEELSMQNIGVKMFYDKLDSTNKIIFDKLITPEAKGLKQHKAKQIRPLVGNISEAAITKRKKKILKGLRSSLNLMNFNEVSG